MFTIKSVALTILFTPKALAFTSCYEPAPKFISVRPKPLRRHVRVSHLSSTPDNGAQTEISKAPSLNGKTILPVKAISAGLRGHKVAAVYAILNSEYRRG